MATITALKPQQRDPERCSVFLDGKFAFGLPVTAALGLRVGQSLSAAEIAVLQHEAEVGRAVNSAIRLIGRRPRSTLEVRRNLQQKGFDEPIIDAAIAQLSQRELLDDFAFANYWIEQRETFKPRSHHALRYELQQKGIDGAVIEAALEEVDEAAAARRAAEEKVRRWTHLEEDQFRARLAGFLQRRGFSYEIVRETTEAIWQAFHAGS